MDQGLHTVSVRDICAVYDVTTRTVNRWLNESGEPAPRFRGGEETYFAMADLMPRVPRDPTRLLLLDWQRRPDASPEIGLGYEIAKRAKRLWMVLTPEQRQKMSEVQAAYREEVARAFWEKVLFLDADHLSHSLLLHPAILQAVVRNADLPDNWEDFCIAFTLANTSPKALWRLTKSSTYHEGKTTYVA